MKIDNKPIADLKRVRQWAHKKIQGGSEPPWAWYQYMKLIETVDAILDGTAAKTTENSRQSEQRQEMRLQLVGANDRQDISLPRPAGSKIRMPM
jgi:hypothetical protein